MSAPKDRLAALEQALGQIDKQFGKGAIMRLGEQEQRRIDVIPTSSLALDVALGVGGLPRGRIIEVYGPESSGKTTLALHAVANVQKAGGLVAFIDAEHALDPIYAQALGVDLESRRWRSPTPSCVLGPSTWSSWTRSLRSCPAPRSRERWATATLACRPAS